MRCDKAGGPLRQGDLLREALRLIMSAVPLFCKEKQGGPPTKHICIQVEDKRHVPFQTCLLARGFFLSECVRSLRSRFLFLRLMEGTHWCPNRCPRNLFRGGHTKDEIMQFITLLCLVRLVLLALIMYCPRREKAM